MEDRAKKEPKLYVNSNSEKVSEITAAEANRISLRHPYNPEEQIRGDILTNIKRGMMQGECASGWFPRPGLQLSQSIIDWLVGLGYLVFHSEPHKASYGKDKEVLQYTYSFYWRFPDDTPADVEPFAPGERWAGRIVERSGAV
jgi:hypothetical protein